MLFFLLTSAPLFAEKPCGLDDPASTYPPSSYLKSPAKGVPTEELVWIGASEFFEYDPLDGIGGGVSRSFRAARREGGAESWNETFWVG